MAKLGYQNSETPKPIVTKFGVGNYVGDVTQQAKIQTDRCSAAFREMGKYHSRVVFISERELSSSSSLYAIAIPSVVCRLSSVTLVHHSQPVEIFGNFSSPYDSPGTLVFLMPKFVGGGRPFPPEICVQSDPPPFKQRNFDQYRRIVPQP